MFYILIFYFYGNILVKKTSPQLWAYFFTFYPNIASITDAPNATEIIVTKIDKTTVIAYNKRIPLEKFFTFLFSFPNACTMSIIIPTNGIEYNNE